MAKRKISLTELSEKVGITQANLSILKNEKAKAIRFSTLDKLCEVLQCSQGELIEYSSESEEARSQSSSTIPSPAPSFGGVNSTGVREFNSRTVSRDSSTVASFCFLAVVLDPGVRWVDIKLQ